VKEKIDTASHKLGRDVDTVVNKLVDSDSLYYRAPIETVGDANLPGETFRSRLNDIFDEYTDIKEELADNDSADAVKQADDFLQVLRKAQTEGASEKLGSKWRLWVSSAEKTAVDIKSGELAKQRAAFSELSAQIEKLVLNFGLEDKTVYKVSCSTVKHANNYWLSDSKDNDTDNPYYGKDDANEKSKPCLKVEKGWKFN
jgi:hypothetical protein